jgi:hypothetical protein
VNLILASTIPGAHQFIQRAPDLDSTGRLAAHRLDERHAGDEIYPEAPREPLQPAGRVHRVPHSATAMT